MRYAPAGLASEQPLSVSTLASWSNHMDSALFGGELCQSVLGLSLTLQQASVRVYEEQLHQHSYPTAVLRLHSLKNEARRGLRVWAGGAAGSNRVIELSTR